MTSVDIKLWRYVVPSRKMEGWGIFLLDSTGYFSTVSDYGNYAFKWSSFGEQDFRQFLCGIDTYYLLSKISTQEFDERATEKEVFRHIIEGRRSGTYTKEEAREHWDLAKEYRVGDGNYEFSRWVEETGIRLDVAMDLSCRSYPVDARMFAERLWPRFIELLKADLVKAA